MWIPLEMNEGCDLFLFKLKTPSKNISTKVYHLLNSWFWFWFVLMNYDGPFGGIPFFFVISIVQ